MSNLVLLIQNESDVTNLPAASQEIINHQYRNVWVVCSPAIAVNIQEASAKYDKEIEDLIAAQKAASEREDYNAASEHKLARQGKELERGAALESAWKQISSDQRNAAISAKLSSLMAAMANHSSKIYCNINVTQDHYDKKNWVSLLNSLSGVWPKPFEAGRFCLAWPGAIPAMGTKIPIVQESNALTVTLDRNLNIVDPKPAAKPKPAKTPIVAATNPDERRKQLTGMPFFTRKSVAGKLGIDVKGKNTEQIVDEIMAKEFAPAAA